MRKIFNGYWYELKVNEDIRSLPYYLRVDYNSHYWHNTGIKA